MSRVLVTGGNGYLGSQVIAALIRQEYEVLTTVRSLSAEPIIREALRRGGVDDGELDVVVADLASDDGWARAVAGVEDVHHVASPIPPTQPEDPDEVILPEREGTLRVLRAAHEAGARRVVMTSSFAAVGYSPKPVRDYLPALQGDRRARRVGLHGPTSRRRGVGRPQSDIHHRTDAGHRAPLLPRRNQGDC